MATRLFGSQTSLREANRANLLASIHKFGAMTQVELAEVTGLSTATVSTLVHQLNDVSMAAQAETDAAADALDAVLDDIESTLESNAEEYVNSFVQKGGE